MQQQFAGLNRNNFPQQQSSNQQQMDTNRSVGVLKAKTTSAIPIASSRIINSTTNPQTINRTQQQTMNNNNSNIPKSSIQNITQQGRQTQQQQNRLLINNENYGLSNIRKHSAGSVEILNEKINSNERLHGMQAQQRGAHLNRLQSNTWKSKSTTRINQMTASTGQQQGAHVRRSSSNRAMPGTPKPTAALSAANSNSNLNQSANSSKLAVMNRSNMPADTSITQFAIADDCSNYGQTTGAGAGGRNLGGMTLVSKWCASFEDDQDDADNSANDLVQVDDLAIGSSNIAQSPTNDEMELSKKLKQASLNEDGVVASNQQIINKCLSKLTNEQQPQPQQQLTKDEHNNQLKEIDGLKCIVNSNSSQKIRLQIIPSNNLILDSSPIKQENDKFNQQLDKKKEADDDEEEGDDEDDDDDDDEEEVELVILEKKIIKNGKVIQVTEEIIEEKSIPKHNSNKNQQDRKINRNQVQDKSKERSKYFEFLDEPDGRITNIVVKTSSPPVLTTAKPVVLNRQQISSPTLNINNKDKLVPTQQTDNRYNYLLQNRHQPNSIERIDTKKNSVNEDSRNCYKIPNAVIRRRDAKRSPISMRSYSDPEHFTGMKPINSDFLYADETGMNERKRSINVPLNYQKTATNNNSSSSRPTSSRQKLNQLLVKSILPIKQRAFEIKIKQLNLPRSWSSPLISTCIRSSLTPPLRQQLSFQNFNEDIVFNLDITRNIAIICGKSDNQLESSLRKNSVFCFNGLLSSSLPNIHLCLEEDRIPLNECGYLKYNNNNLRKEESGSSASNSSNHNLYNHHLKGNNKSNTNVDKNRNQQPKQQQQQQQHQYNKSDSREKKNDLDKRENDNDDNISPSTQPTNNLTPILSSKTATYFAQKRALQSVDDQDDDEEDDVEEAEEEEEEEETDPNAISNYLTNSAKRYSNITNISKQITSPVVDSNNALLLKSFSGSTGRMNRLGSTGSTTAYNSAYSSTTNNRSPYNNHQSVTRSSTTSNFSSAANVNLNSKLSSGFNSSLTGLSNLSNLSSLTNSNPLTKFSIDMPMPFRRKKRTTTSINMFNNSPIYNTTSSNYTFNNHLNNLNSSSNYNGSYTNLHNINTVAATTATTGLISGNNLINTGIIGATSATKYIPSTEFFLRQSITSSPSSSSSNFSSANLSSGNYLSNYLANNQTSSSLSHHHTSNNNYLAFKSSNNTGLSTATSNYRALPNSYSSTSGNTGYNSSSNLYSNRLIAGLSTGLSTQPTTDTDLSLIR